MSLLRVGLIVLVSTASLFADDLTGSFEGRGEWRMPDGSKGAWTSVMTVARAQKAIKVKEVLKIRKPDMTEYVEEMSWEATLKDHGFFDVSMDGKVTGWGHCFRQVCQITSKGKEANSRWSETLRLSKDGIFRIGTDHGDKMQISWRGVMNRKK